VYKRQVYARAAEVAAELLRDVLAQDEPRFEPQPDEGVGDHRVMYDLVNEDRVLLVLGIVHRRDLERWLRSR